MTILTVLLIWLLIWVIRRWWLKLSLFVSGYSYFKWEETFKGFSVNEGGVPFNIHISWRSDLTGDSDQNVNSKIVVYLYFLSLRVYSELLFAK